MNYQIGGFATNMKYVFDSNKYINDRFTKTFFPPRKNFITVKKNRTCPQFAAYGCAGNCVPCPASAALPLHPPFPPCPRGEAEPVPYTSEWQPEKIKIQIKGKIAKIHFFKPTSKIRGDVKVESALFLASQRNSTYFSTRSSLNSSGTIGDLRLQMAKYFLKIINQ